MTEYFYISNNDNNFLAAGKNKSTVKRAIEYNGIDYYDIEKIDSETFYNYGGMLNHKKEILREVKQKGYWIGD